MCIYYHWKTLLHMHQIAFHNIVILKADITNWHYGVFWLDIAKIVSHCQCMIINLLIKRVDDMEDVCKELFIEIWLVNEWE